MKEGKRRRGMTVPGWRETTFPFARPCPPDGAAMSWPSSRSGSLPAQPVTQMLCCVFEAHLVLQGGERADISVSSPHLLQMKGLGVIIQDSYFKAAFQLCEGNFSMMLLGEVVTEQLSQPQSPQLLGCWQPRLSGTRVLQAVEVALGAALLWGGVCVQGALQAQGTGDIPPRHSPWHQGAHPSTLDATVRLHRWIYRGFQMS